VGRRLAAVTRAAAAGLLLAGLAAAGGIAGTRAIAAPPEASAVRRTTIATADPDASLRFYRDLLGFRVEYDVTVEDPAQLALFAPGARSARAIALRAGPGLGGSVGLFHAPGMAPPGSCRPEVAAGTVSLLFLVDDVEAWQARLAGAGVPFLTGPVAYSESRGPTDAFTVFDPSCVRVAFARIRNERLEESTAR